MMATAPATKTGSVRRSMPPHPEHGRQLARQEQVGRQGPGHEGQPDDVVDLAVVDGRFRAERTGPHRGQGKGDGGHEAHIGEGRLEAGVLDQRRQRVVVRHHHHDQQHRIWTVVRTRAGAWCQRCCAWCFHRPAVERHVSMPTGSNLTTSVIRSARARSRRSVGRCGSSNTLLGRARLDDVARADPHRPGGTGRSCATPAGPAACCG